MTRSLGPQGQAATDATELILEIAGLQHGVIARRQLLEAGIRPGLIDGRITNGRLVPVFNGVYSLGTGILNRQGRWMASCLGAGPRSVLSHRSAAALHGLIRPGTTAIEVIRPTSEGARLISRTGAGSRQFSAVVHATRSLPSRDVTEVSGIPVTSAVRTLLDLASVVSLKRTRSALTEAERLRMLSRPDLLEVTERGRGWHGIRRLRQAMEELDPAELETNSDLEVEMIRLCKSNDIEPPSVNVAVGPFMVDFLWKESRLVVEVDGFQSHGRRTMFRSDRARDVDLQIRGFRVARFTYQDVIHDESATAGKLQTLLKLSRPR